MSKKKESALASGTDNSRLKKDEQIVASQKTFWSMREKNIFLI